MGTYEALDLVLARPDAGENPLPQNVVAVCDINCNGLGAHDRRSKESSSDVRILSDECWCAELLMDTG